MARLGQGRPARAAKQNMRIQAFLTAAAINLKRLAAALADLLATLGALPIRIAAEPIVLVLIQRAHDQVGRCSS